MANFGESFTRGLGAGTEVAGKWIDNYNKRKEEEVSNKLFTAGQQLSQEGAHLDAEGNEIAGMSDAFSKASPDDMAGMMMKQLVASGGKIDDNTARLAYGVAEQITGLRDKAAGYGEKRKLFELKKQNYDSMIERRNYLNTHGGGSGGGEGVGISDGDVKGETKFGKWLKDNNYSLNGRSKTQRNKLFSRFMEDEKPDTKLIKGEELAYDENGDIDYSKVKIGGKLFTSLTPDARRKVQEEQGIIGVPSPKSKSEYDDLLGPDTAAAPKEEKRKSSGKAPKGVKDGKYKVRGKNVEVINGVMYPL